jgi:hypothetical protein
LVVWGARTVTVNTHLSIAHFKAMGRTDRAAIRRGRRRRFDIGPPTPAFEISPATAEPPSPDRR